MKRLTLITTKEAYYDVSDDKAAQILKLWEHSNRRYPAKVLNEFTDIDSYVVNYRLAVEPIADQEDGDA